MKYSDEKIKEALKLLNLNFETPEIKFCTSKLKLVDGQISNTHSFVHKKYSLYGIPFFPSHEYLEIDGNTFHPGALDIDIFIKNDTSKGIITKIEEKCNYCTHKFLLDLFNRDQKFNIFINNCQIILGNWFVTVLLWVGLIFLWTFCIIPAPLFLFIGLFIITLAISYDRLNDSKNVVEYQTCPHIIKV